MSDSKATDTFCKHGFFSQTNEGGESMHYTKYVPKTKYSSKSIYLEAGVKNTAGIYNCGFHFFWTNVMKAL